MSALAARLQEIARSQGGCYAPASGSGYFGNAMIGGARRRKTTRRRRPTRKTMLRRLFGLGMGGKRSMGTRGHKRGHIVKKKLTTYNRHVAREMRAGKTMEQAARSWRSRRGRGLMGSAYSLPSWAVPGIVGNLPKNKKGEEWFQDHIPDDLYDLLGFGDEGMPTKYGNYNPVPRKKKAVNKDAKDAWKALMAALS